MLDMKAILAALLSAILAGCATVKPEQAPSQDASGTRTVASGYSGIVGVPKLKERRADAVSFPCDAPVKVKVATRTADSGENGAIYFREFTIAPDGRILSISAETDAMGVYTDQ